MSLLPKKRFPFEIRGMFLNNDSEFQEQIFPPNQPLMIQNVSIELK